MDITMKTPVCVDKVIAWFKTAGEVIAKAFMKTVQFCKVHSPLILLIAGTALCVTGFILARIWAKEEGAREKELELLYTNAEMDKKEKRQMIVKKVVPIVLFILGTAAQIGSYIISAGRISALSKALATALNAGSILGVAKLEADSQEQKDDIEVARNAFSRKISDMPCYDEKDPYQTLIDIENRIRYCKHRIEGYGSMTWNDVLLQFYFKPVNEGYTIGWKNADDFEVVIVDAYNNEVNLHDAVLEAVTGNLQGYRVFFTGMTSLLEEKYRVEGE